MRTGVNVTGRPSRIMRCVSSALSTIPPTQRRRAAATLGLFTVLFLAVGAVALTGGPDVVVHVFAIIALVTAVLLGLMAWGLAHSVRLDGARERALAADAELNAAIEQALAEHGGASCGCGHDHDPSEMHITDAEPACESDGADCDHSCDTCALAALRPSPTTPRAERLQG